MQLRGGPPRLVLTKTPTRPRSAAGIRAGGSMTRRSRENVSNARRARESTKARVGASAARQGARAASSGAAGAPPANARAQTIHHAWQPRTLLPLS